MLYFLRQTPLLTPAVVDLTAEINNFNVSVDNDTQERASDVLFIRSHLAKAQNVILGRSRASSNVFIGLAAHVSRRHAFVRLHDTGQWWLYDTSSTGVFVNGEKLKQKHHLQTDDMIAFGKHDDLTTTFLVYFNDKISQDKKRMREHSLQNKVLTKTQENLSSPKRNNIVIDLIDSSSSSDDEEDVFRRRLQREISCSICLDAYVRPVVLECTHTFCRDCILDCLRRKAQCPLCRSLISSPPLHSASLSNITQLALTGEEKTLHQKRLRATSLIDVAQTKQLSRIQAIVKFAMTSRRKCRVRQIFSCPWQEHDKLLFRQQAKELSGNALIHYCASVGLTPSSPLTASSQALVYALTNASIAMDDSASIQQMQHALISLVLFGTGLSAESSYLQHIHI